MSWTTHTHTHTHTVGSGVPRVLDYASKLTLALEPPKGRLCLSYMWDRACMMIRHSMYDDVT